MEDHPPITEKKRFKTYLLEGLMIFIAVMLGFFAESLRENINDREKEKEYINSLINNLRQDTTDLTHTTRYNQIKIAGLDSILSLSSKNIPDPRIKALLYRYYGYISMSSRFSSNDATMLQLQHSGGLQYIKRGHVADSIAFYDQMVRDIYAAEIPYLKAISDATDAMSELLILRLVTDTVYFRKGSPTDKELPLLTADAQNIEIFFNKISIERGWTQNYLDNIKQRIPYTIRLIELLKKEYDLD